MKHLQNYPLINESRSQEINESKFKELLDSKCTNWSLDNAQIYRGVSKNVHPFIYMNPKGHSRFLTYAKGTNIYTVVMDNATQWKDFPKRSESIVATNDWSFTSDYAEWGGDNHDYLLYHVVIPFDDTKWGINT
jgi:hypothetical protein